MHKLMIPFLIAGSEMLEKIKNLMPKLAHQIGVPVQELFYFWMSSRRAKTWEYFIHASKTEMEKYGQGIIENTNWKCFFHGFECDLDHMKDGSHLRIEFGPKGRIDIFSGFAVMEYIMASKPPWPEYKELKEFLVKPPEYYSASLKDEFASKLTSMLEGKKLKEVLASIDNPPEYLSGSYDKMCVLEEELWKHKFVEIADPKLWQLVEKCTTTDDDMTTVNLPKSTTDKERIDSLVCNQWIISAKGKIQIQKYQT